MDVHCKFFSFSVCLKIAFHDEMAELGESSLFTCPKESNFIALFCGPFFGEVLPYCLPDPHRLWSQTTDIFGGMRGVSNLVVTQIRCSPVIVEIIN